MWLDKLGFWLSKRGMEAWTYLTEDETPDRLVAALALLAGGLYLGCSLAQRWLETGILIGGGEWYFAMYAPLRKATPHTPGFSLFMARAFLTVGILVEVWRRGLRYHAWGAVAMSAASCILMATALYTVLRPPQIRRRATLRRQLKDLWNRPALEHG